MVVTSEALTCHRLFRCQNPTQKKSLKDTATQGIYPHTVRKDTNCMNKDGEPTIYL